MGSNLRYEGLKEVLDSMKRSRSEGKEPDLKEVHKDWKRLASFMAGRT